METCYFGWYGHAWPHTTNLKKSEETFHVYLLAKNQLHPSSFPWDTVKILQTCCFGYFCHTWLSTPKVILSTCRRLSCYLQAKKINFIPHVFLEILQWYANFSFWVISACLACTPNMMVWTCRKLWGLSAWQNYSLSFTSFLGCYTLKNPAIWLSNSILTHKWRTGICQIWDSMWNINITILDFYQILDYFLEKLMTKFFKKIPKKTLFCGHFGPCFSKFWQKWIFLEKCCQFLNIPSIYHSERKSEKTNDPFLR